MKYSPSNLTEIKQGLSKKKFIETLIKKKIKYTLTIQMKKMNLIIF